MMKSYDLNSYTKKELLEIPYIGNGCEIEKDIKFDSFVVVPTGYAHDSGFGCMKFILVKKGKIIGAVGGGSDVIHLDGIGGYGKWENVIRAPRRRSWNIDCLKRSKCLRVWVNKELIIPKGFVCSDFEVIVDD